MKKFLILFILLFPITLYSQVKAIIAYDTPYYFSEEAGTYAAGEYKKGDTVLIVNFTFLRARVVDKHQRKTYVSQGCFIESDDLKAFKQQLEIMQKQAFEASEKKRYATIDQIKAQYTKMYGKQNAIRIVNHWVAIGMTESMVTASLGYPTSKNVTETKYGSDEQWVYPKQYLYFTNGKLTAIQSSK